MRNAIVLLRVSSDGQTKRAGSEEGYSFEVQREGCYTKARQCEAEVVREFVAPAQSASKGVYPALRQALDFARQRGDIDYFIVYRLDRFARDELTQFAALAELRVAGTQLVSVTEPIDNSPQGLFSLGILASVNAYRSREDAKKIKEGLIKKAQKGGTPIRAPLGYRNVREWDGRNDIRSVVIDPERMPHIQWAFAAYSTGEYTLNELVEALYARGLRSIKTKRYPSGKVPRSTVNKFLRNPYYIGIVRYRGAEYPGNHPTFIDEGTFLKVQQVLDNHNRSGEKHWRHANPLKGTVYCGLCERRLVFTQVRGHRGGKYRYFLCGGRHRREGCSQRYLSETAVEDAVARHYARTIRFDAERVADLEARLVQAFKLVTAHRDRQLVAERKLLDRLEGERRRLLDAHVAGAVPLDLLTEKQADLSAQLAEIRGKLAAAQQSTAVTKRALGLARTLLQKAGDAYYEVDGLTQRTWNQTFFRRLYIQPDQDGTPQVARSDWAEPFRQLRSEQLARCVRRITANPAPAFAGGGSNVEQIVETVGVEPTSAVA